MANPQVIDERPLYGTTLFLATCPLATRFGLFRAYIFQDLLDKHYIIALSQGDILQAKTLHIRIHSSCVTSATLRGCDCDCVQQMEGAFKVIAAKGSGIFFTSCRMNLPDSLVKKPEYAEALNRHKVEVERWIFLDNESLNHPASAGHTH